jgi:RNA methyltransferase, TrmH family
VVRPRRVVTLGRVQDRWRALAATELLLDGFHALKHALRFGARVHLAVATDRAAVLTLARDLAPDIADRLDPLLVQGPLAQLVPRVHPTGVAALAAYPVVTLPEHRTAPLVLLDNPRNMGNIGAVVRLAAGFGVTGVVTTGDADPWHPSVVRAAAGLHFATSVARVTAPPAGPLFVLDPEGDDIRTLDFPADAVLAFGSERHGVSPSLRAAASSLVAIPMRPGVSSFNLATSVGMALFHWSTKSF